MSSLNLVAFDDFTPRAREIRRLALEQSFDPVEWNGHTYKGIGKDYDPDLTLQMQNTIGGPVSPVMSFFRLEREGDDSTSWIHADTSVNAAYASVLYLTEPPAPLCGTAFWTHKELATDSLPPRFEEREQFIQDNGELLRADAADPDKWVLNGVVGMKFNRFVMYPTRMFHSRYPKQAFGKTKSEGRLIWVCFFNLGRPSA